MTLLSAEVSWDGNLGGVELVQKQFVLNGSFMEGAVTISIVQNERDLDAVGAICFSCFAAFIHETEMPESFFQGDCWD